jgi:hypothetical protein
MHYFAYPYHALELPKASLSFFGNVSKVRVELSDAEALMAIRTFSKA